MAKAKVVAPLLVLNTVASAIVDHAVEFVTKSCLAFAKAQTALNKRKDSVDAVMLDAIKTAHRTYLEYDGATEAEWMQMLTAFLPDKRKQVCSNASLFTAVEALGGDPVTIDNRAYRARIVWRYVYDHPDCKVPKKDKDGSVTMVDGSLQSITTAVAAAKKSQDAPATTPQAPTGDAFEQLVALLTLPVAIERIAAILFTASATTAAAKQLHAVAVSLEKKTA